MEIGGDATERKHTIGLVAVSYRSEPEIVQLLQSLAGDRPSLSVEVVVVSNSGDCGALDKQENVRVVHPGGNIGYARACNLGASLLKTEYIVFCNPDVRISEECVYALADTLAANPEFGMMSPFESQHALSCLPSGKVFDASKTSRCIGHCFVIRRDFFEAIGGWDEGFFLYWEDTELRDRVVDRGKKIGFAEGITVLHSGQHSVVNLQPGQRKFLAQAYLCSHAYYILARRGKLAVFLWLVRTCVKNGCKLLLRGRRGPDSQVRVPHRSVFYHLYDVKALFSLRMLANFYRLTSFVKFDGRRFPWQQD